MVIQDLARVMKTLGILYPKTMEDHESVRLWREEFEARDDPDFVVAQLRNYSKQNIYISIPEFLQWLREADLLAQDQAKLATGRLDAARQQSQSRRDAEDRERAAARATWKQVDAMIAKIPDDELAALKNLAIEGYSLLNEYGREFLRTLDPRKSSMLKRLIYAQCSPA